MKPTPLKLAYLCLLLLAMGCSGSKYGATVEGTVTLDGKPVGPGTVIFAPANGKSNPPRGNIDAGGKYTLNTAGIEGLQPGKYQVAVLVYKEVQGLQPGERNTAPSEFLTPEKYGSPTTSGLEYTVEAGANVHNIELTSQ